MGVIGRAIKTAVAIIIAAGFMASCSIIEDNFGLNGESRSVDISGNGGDSENQVYEVSSDAKTNEHKDGAEPDENDKIHDIILECIKGNLVTSSFGWLHYQSLEDEAADYRDNHIIDNSCEVNTELTDENITFITNVLVSTEYEILQEDAEANTGFNIHLEYDTGCKIEIRLSDSEVYMNIWHDDEKVYCTKVLNCGLYEYIIMFADDAIDGFAMDAFNGIDYVTIHYVEDNGLAEFYGNGKTSVINITEGDILEEIKLAFKDAEAIETNEMAGRADIILHTSDGREYYGKITYPPEEDSTDATIVMEGYFWYRCEGLYATLGELAAGD
ncbi:MAG: hypothetical protein JXN65_10275 [Clostridia bacterium]|nr:hypothetical protein [Clostridia bacterium]